MAREQLRRAHALRREAEAKLTEARDAAARADELVSEQKRELAEHDRASEEIAARGAAKIVAGIRRLVPRHDEEAEPSLSQRLADRAEIVRRVGISDRAAQTLHAEVEEAEREVGRGAYAVEEAAGRLLLLEEASASQRRFSTTKPAPAMHASSSRGLRGCGSTPRRGHRLRSSSASQRCVP
jgi:hypothetical protein